MLLFLLVELMMIVSPGVRTKKRRRCGVMGAVAVTMDDVNEERETFRNLSSSDVEASSWLINQHDVYYL